MLDQDHYSFSAYDISTLHENQSLPSSSPGDIGRRIAETFEGIDVDELDRGISIQFITVLLGSYDRDLFVSQFEDRNVTKRKTNGSFSIYANDENVAFAVGDDAVVIAPLAFPMDRAFDYVDKIVQAYLGDTKRYTETSDACDQLTAEAGEGTVTTARTHSRGGTFSEAIGSANTWTVDGEQTSFENVVLFDSAEAADPDRVSQQIDRAPFFNEYQDVSVQQDGRIVRTTGTIDTATFDDARRPWNGPKEQPQSKSGSATFESTYDSQAGTLTIRFDGGTVMQRSHLYLVGNGFRQVEDADQTSQGVWKGDASATLRGDPAVTSGDSVVVGVHPDFQIRLVWRSLSGERTDEIDQFSGPKA